MHPSGRAALYPCDRLLGGLAPAECAGELGSGTEERGGCGAGEAAEVPDQVGLVEVSHARRHSAPAARGKALEQAEGGAEAEDAAEQRRVHPDLRPEAALESPRGKSDRPCQLADGAGAAGFEAGDRGLDGAGGSSGERAGERGPEAGRAAADVGLRPHRIEQARLEAADHVGEGHDPPGKLVLRGEQAMGRAGAEPDADDIGPGA